MYRGSISTLILATGIVLGSSGCGSTSNNPASTGGANSAGGTSASTGTGLGGATGAGTTATGGSTNAGGTFASAGGTTSATSSTSAAGGNVAAGGSATGGTKAGTSAAGGNVAAGGSATGGTKAAGGVTATTTTSITATGGTSNAAGGTSTAGGTPATGGTKAAGGSTSNGGSNAAGGSAGSSAASSGGTNAGGGSACPTVSDFATWPSGKDPLTIGKLAVTNFKSHTGDDYGGAGYAWTFSYFGALQFTKLTGDTTNNATLISGFERYASGSTAAPDNSTSATVDTRAFGDLPLEIYIENQDTRCKTLGMARADQQWANTTSDGITSDARYWADDMYMITGLQMFAYRATQDTKYLDRAAKTMLAYVTALQNPSDGLFYHTKTVKAYWGRANGWVAAGMTELLLDLPTGSARTSIMTAFTNMMNGLLKVQITDGGADNGCWRQVLDVPSASAETSCTAMFTYALVNAVKNGWLTDAKYSTAARNGWLGLGAKTNSSGQLSQVCPGTAASTATTLAAQQAYYENIALGSNDMHGQAPLLWAAKALLRTDCPGVR